MIDDFLYRTQKQKWIFRELVFLNLLYGTFYTSTQYDLKTYLDKIHFIW